MCNVLIEDERWCPDSDITDYKLQLFLSDEWFMNILNMRNDQKIRKYDNIAECR